MIKLPAQLTSYNDKVDGSASLRFSTQELTDEEILILRRFRGGAGWLLFAENDIQEADVPKDEAIYEGKSPSQRLYNVMFKLWKETDGIGDFNSWYRIQMEKIITAYKNKLP